LKTKKDKYLLLKGVAGIGDRLHILAAAIDYCERNNRKIIVDWADGVFAAPGTDLFEKYFTCLHPLYCKQKPSANELTEMSFYPDIFRSFIYDDIYNHYTPVHPGFIARFPRRFIPDGKWCKIYGYWCYNSNQIYKALGILLNINNKHDILQGRYLPDDIRSDVVVYADMANISRKETFLKYIQIKDLIKSQIEKFVAEANLSEKSIGLHIRNTDKKPLNSTATLIEHIKRKFGSDYTIFVATDNKNTEEEIKAHFTNVVKFDKFLPEVHIGGVHHYAQQTKNWEKAELVLEQSIIDMWLLAKCEYLYYLGNSSFSVISSYLHNNAAKQTDWNMLQQ